jgi:hypothetical protein
MVNERFETTTPEIYQGAFDVLNEFKEYNKTTTWGSMLSGVRAVAGTGENFAVEQEMRGEAWLILHEDSLRAIGLSGQVLAIQTSRARFSEEDHAPRPRVYKYTFRDPQEQSVGTVECRVNDFEAFTDFLQSLRGLALDTQQSGVVGDLAKVTEKQLIADTYFGVQNLAKHQQVSAAYQQVGLALANTEAVRSYEQVIKSAEGNYLLEYLLLRGIGYDAEQVDHEHFASLNGIGWGGGDPEFFYECITKPIDYLETCLGNPNARQLATSFYNYLHNTYTGMMPLAIDAMYFGDTSGNGAWVDNSDFYNELAEKAETFLAKAMERLSLMATYYELEIRP